ncbi:MAG: phytanoyl-CoA dioxygenase family protein [Phycisphaerales bacterium]|nr:phytanoyl-CoA dioxygenase family protein [Phycisphaerales bacterium]
MKHEPEKWKADYNRDGYVVVPDALDVATLASLRKGIEKITADLDAYPPHLRQFLNLERDYIKVKSAQNELTAQQVGNAVRNIMELPRFDPVFADLICFQPLLDVLETIFDSSEFSFHNYKCIVKAPRVSSKFVWHRDLPYLKHSTPNLITAMLCLDEMTEANGATVVMPGTHRIAHEDVLDSDVDIPEDKLPAGERVTVKCPAGSAVLFHVNIIHGGGANRSDIPRRNVIGIWAGPDTYSVEQIRFAYQDLMPRSKDPARQKQLRMTYPHLYGGKH